jgi:hypothetical protein
MFEIYSTETETNFFLGDILQSTACDFARKTARKKDQALVLIDLDERIERTFYPDGSNTSWRPADLSHWALD